jgi:death-on-curing family protein
MGKRSSAELQSARSRIVQSASVRPRWLALALLGKQAWTVKNPSLVSGLARLRPLRPHARYENADLALQAAVVAHGIAEGQTFIDGNKRIALVAMLTFLEINGFRVKASDRELADWIIGLSAGATPVDLAKILRTARA